MRNVFLSTAVVYPRGGIQLFPLPLNDLIIIFILFKFLLASVKQHLTEVHSGSCLVRGIDSKLKR